MGSFPSPVPPPELTLQRGHRYAVTAISFSPDGKRIASCDFDGGALWDLPSRRQIASFDENSIATMLFVDGELLVVSKVIREDQVRLERWSLDDGLRLRASWIADGTFESVTIDRRGSVLAVITKPDYTQTEQRQQILLLNAGDGNVRASIDTPGIERVLLSDDGRLVAVRDRNRSWMIHDTESGAPLLDLGTHSVYGFTPDSKLMACSQGNDAVALREVATGRPIQDLPPLTGEVMGVAFSPFGRLLLIAGCDGTLALYDLGGNRLRWSYQVTDTMLTAVAFSADGATVASGEWSGIIRLFDSLSGEQTATLQGIAGSGMSIAMSQDCRVVATAGSDRSIQALDLSSGTLVRVREVPRGERGRKLQIDSPPVAVGPRGRYLASPLVSKEVEIFDTTDGTLVFTVPRDAGFETMSFSPDERYLVGGDYQIVVWEIGAARELHRFVAVGSSGRPRAISPDSRYVAAADDQATIRVWDVQTGVSCCEFSAGSSGVVSLLFRSDGVLLVYLANEGLTLWTIPNGERIPNAQLPPEQEYRRRTFDADGRWMATCAYDNLMRLVDIDSGEERAVIQGVDQESRIAFSPQGSIVAIAHRGIVRYHRTFDGEPVATLYQLRDEWIAVATDGRFDSSPNAAELVHVVSGLDVQTIDTVTTFRRHEGLLGEMLDLHDLERLVFVPVEDTTKPAGGLVPRTSVLEVSTAVEDPDVVLQQGHHIGTSSIDFVPASELLVARWQDNDATIWDIDTGRVVRRFDQMHEQTAISRSRRIFANCSNGTLRLWDLQGRRELRRITGSFSSRLLCIGGESVVASLDDDGSVTAWSIDTGELLFTRRTRLGVVEQLRFSPDGGVLAGKCRDLSITFWEVPSGRELSMFTGAKEYIYWISLAPDNRTAIVHSEGAVNSVSIKNGAILSTLNVGNYPQPQVSVDSTLLAAPVESFGSEVVLFDLAKGAPRAKLKATEAIRDIAFSPDGSLLVSTEPWGTLKLWETTSGNEVCRIGTEWLREEWNELVRIRRVEQEERWKNEWEVRRQMLRERADRSAESGPFIGHLTFSPDGALLVADILDHVIAWETATGTLVHDSKIPNTTSSEPEGITSIDFNADGTTVAVTIDGSIHLYDTSQWRIQRVLPCRADREPIAAARIASDWLRAAKIESGQLRLYHSSGPIRSMTCGRCSASPTAVAFAPDSGTMAVGWTNGDVELRSVDGTVLHRRESAHGDPVDEHESASGVLSLSFSSDGRWLASGGVDGVVWLWDLRSDCSPRRCVSASSRVESIAFSPDAKLVGVASKRKIWNWFGEIRIWDLESGEERLYDGEPLGFGKISQRQGGFDPAVDGHQFVATALAFTLDGRFLVSAGGGRQPGEHSHDCVLKWDLSDGRVVFASPDYRNWTPLLISRDCSRVLYGTNEGRVVVRDMESWEESMTFPGFECYRASSLATDDMGRSLVVGYDDGSLVLWDLRTGELGARLLPTLDRGWVALSPDGAFDTSESSLDQIDWVDGLSVVATGHDRAALRCSWLVKRWLERHAPM